MPEQEKTVEELKHLVRYYQRALKEFFEETSGELEERAEAVFQCLKKNQNSRTEYRKMIDLLLTSQAGLKKRVSDLEFLTKRMKKLLLAE